MLLFPFIEVTPSCHLIGTGLHARCDNRQMDGILRRLKQHAESTDNADIDCIPRTSALTIALACDH